MASTSVELTASTTGDTLNKAWKNDKNKFGLKMLQKMGWTEGKGLGKHEDGVSEHVKVAKKSNNLGLGATRDSTGAAGWASTAVSFNGVLEALGKAYGNKAEKKSSKKKKRKSKKGDKKPKSEERDSEHVDSTSSSRGDAASAPASHPSSSAATLQAASSCPSRARRVRSKDVKNFSTADLRAILGQAATTTPTLTYPVIRGDISSSSSSSSSSNTRSSPRRGEDGEVESRNKKTSSASSSSSSSSKKKNKKRSRQERDRDQHSLVDGNSSSSSGTNAYPNNSTTSMKNHSTRSGDTPPDAQSEASATVEAATKPHRPRTRSMDLAEPHEAGGSRVSSVGIRRPRNRSIDHEEEGQGVNPTISNGTAAVKGNGRHGGVEEPEGSKSRARKKKGKKDGLVPNDAEVRIEVGGRGEEATATSKREKKRLKKGKGQRAAGKES